jgi:hypothetical protein
MTACHEPVSLVLRCLIDTLSSTRLLALAEGTLASVGW